MDKLFFQLHKGEQHFAQGAVQCDGERLTIVLDGYEVAGVASGEGAVVGMELAPDGFPVVHVWSDLRTESPTHEINLAGAAAAPSEVVVSTEQLRQWAADLRNSTLRDRSGAVAGVVAGIESVAAGRRVVVDNPCAEIILPDQEPTDSQDDGWAIGPCGAHARVQAVGGSRKLKDQPARRRGAVEAARKAGWRVDAQGFLIDATGQRVVRPAGKLTPATLPSSRHRDPANRPGPVALIEIPHQRKARVHWYADRDALRVEAADEACSRGRDRPDDFDDAVRLLADDWHGWLVVESAADLPAVAEYRGHQQHAVRGTLAELRETFA